jgi:hypothetical protein
MYLAFTKLKNTHLTIHVLFHLDWHRHPSHQWACSLSQILHHAS